MRKGDSFSISFHQGEVDFPYNLKIYVEKISNATPPTFTYRFLALTSDNGNNPDNQFIVAFFQALSYLQSDPNFSGLKVEYRRPNPNPSNIYFERVIHLDRPIFDSLFITGFVAEAEVVITSLSAPPVRGTRSSVKHL
jgi:hypothetical protein